MNIEDLTDLIYRISPEASPFITLENINRRRFTRPAKSLRGIKRRIGKPCKFTPCFKTAIRYEWKTDALI